MEDNYSFMQFVPAASVVDCNKLMNAIGHSGSSNFAAQLSANGLPPTTYFANHSWETPERAALKQAMAGVNAALPEIEGDWSDFGLTPETALAAAKKISASVPIPDEDESEEVPANTLASRHFQSALAIRQLQTVVFDE